MSLPPSGPSISLGPPSSTLLFRLTRRMKQADSTERCRWGNYSVLLAGYVVYQFFEASHASIHAIGYRFALIGVLQAIFLHTL